MPYGSVTVSRVVSVADGDCFVCNIDNWPAVIGLRIPVRLAHMDAIELNDTRPKASELAYRAKHFLEASLKRAHNIELRNIKRGKYFRIMAEVFVDGHDLSEIMIAHGLALPYEGGKKPVWSNLS